MSWCQHTRGEVSPTVKPEYYWEYCPICGLPRDKNKTRKTIDEIFADVITKMTIGYTVLFILLIIFYIIK